MTERVWTCQRVTDGVKCGARNPKRLQICPVCSKRRPATKKPAHMRALDLPYELYVQVNGGSEDCGICGEPRGARRHHRDHEHDGSGRPRGILCWKCNGNLPRYVDAEWCRRAAAYLERAALVDENGVRAVTPLVERAA